MRAFANTTRLLGMACLLTLLLATAARSQTVGASPTDVSFGVPFASPTPSPATSAAQTVTVNLTGTTPISFTSVSVTGPNASDFAANTGNCTGTINPAVTTSCQIVVTFTASLAPATTLETANLVVVTNGTPATLTVPMNGAYGAIELFGALNTNPSLFSGVTWPQSAGNPVKTTTINLSCPAGVPFKAVLSSTPDGNGNLFQDNTLQVVNTVNGTPTTTSNVCNGGDPNFQGFTGFPAGTSNCFQQSYEGAAGNSGIFGNNPDLPLAALNNASIAQVYGIKPIDLQNTTNLYPAILQGGSQSLTVQLIDAGGDLGASTVHLVTNCTPAGVTPGGSIAGNPVTSDPSSQTQTFAFDTAPGQNISITSSDANSGVANTSGVVPVVTDFGIPQAQFNQLVAGTSAAPAVCLRLAGEVDSMGNALCKGYLIQCFNKNTNTTTGDNCVTGADQLRTLFDTAQFASPDAPEGQGNYLTAISCKKIVGPSGTCAPSGPGQLIGAGILLGSDNWLTLTGGNYSVSNCSFGNTGTLQNTVFCPLDTLTQFKGAADPYAGSTTTGRNSIFVPVANMPLPYTAASMNNSTNGWVKTGSPTAAFVSNPATYPATPPATIPGGNGFSPAPIYSLTYGLTPLGTAVPDTTFPVPGDTTNLNTNANPNFGPPACPSNGNMGTTVPGGAFTSPGNFLGLADGIYNIHYFATDCAFTEELLFLPTNTTDPTANWASFEVLSFGVDTGIPQLTWCNTTPSAAFGSGLTAWYASNVTETCSWNDPQNGGFASGFGSGTGTTGAPNVLQGSLTTTTSGVTTAGWVAGAFPIAAQSVTDLAGNTSAIVPAASFNIDMQPPTISPIGGGGATYTVGGSPATITFSCNDFLGSGIAGCAATGLPVSGVTGPTCMQTTELWTCTASVTPIAGNVGSYTINVTSTDNVGNAAPPMYASLKIVYASTQANMLFTQLPALAIPGRTLQLYIAAADFSPAKTPTVVYGGAASITMTMPSGTLSGSASALYASVNCSSFPCTDTPSSGAPCVTSTMTSGNTTTVTVSCTLGTLYDAFTTRSGDVIRVTLPIAPKAQFGKIISSSGKFTAASPITGQTSFNTPILIF